MSPMTVSIIVSYFLTHSQYCTIITNSYEEPMVTKRLHYSNNREHSRNRYLSLQSPDDLWFATRESYVLGVFYKTYPIKYYVSPSKL